MQHRENLLRWADAVNLIAETIEADCPASAADTPLEDASHTFMHALNDAAAGLRRALSE